MPRLVIFIVGILVGSALATGIAQGPEGNRDAVVGINHVAIVVENMGRSDSLLQGTRWGSPKHFG